MVTTILRGGLGNQLFQIAQLVGHALRHGISYVLPLDVDTPHADAPNLYRVGTLVYGTPPFASLPKYNEVSFDYTEIPRVDNVCFNGYWQSFKYFEDVNDEVLRLLGFKWVYRNGICAVHVRRGDYLKLPDYHPFVGEDYYYEAMYLIAKTTGVHKFRFYSNDIEWCRQTFVKNELYEYEFDTDENPLHNLEAGSFCEHQILSNSTFSLWMHHLNLNPGKKCVAPKRWFGSKLQHDTKDLYPKTAMII